MTIFMYTRIDFGNAIYTGIVSFYINSYSLFLGDVVLN